MIDGEAILSGLNDAQREAVVTTEGPLLIVAGAGSGKTRAITHRVAYLVATGRAAPHQIVAVTFTNKAAGEMRERVERLLGQDAAGSRIGTFHALCLRILRRDFARAGLPAAFQIYDTADQLAVLRGAMKDLGIDEGQLTPRALLARISGAKNKLLSPEAFAARAVLPEARITALAYAEYQTRLRQQGGVDFDDLIVEVLRLLENDEEAAARYAQGCRYLLVDEYQDTNHGQYRLVRALAAAHGNLCCVGDQDQSIYGFRGADSRNITEFESDYPEARIVRLERNYRSTRTILRAAGAVIEKNDRRHPTRLWTENEEGLPVHYHRARDDKDEAEAVVRILASLSRTFSSGEVAVLYRTNNQSRLIEESLVQAGVRYRIVGSLRFYERKEIKDLLAYLRLLVAPDDDASFLRVVNTPARGVGKASLDQIAALAAERGLPLPRAARCAIDERALPARAAAALAELFRTLDSLRPGARPAGPPPGGALLDAGWAESPEAGGAPEIDGSPAGGLPPGSDPAPSRVVPLLAAVLSSTGFREHIERSHPGDHEDRIENIEALVSAAAEFDEQEPGAGLQAFLDRATLRGDTDDVQGDTGVTLLTIHSAKGLEFSAVVLTGLEENLFPHIRSSASAEELEEERRLCYVALTRAKKRLVLTNAVMRRSFGDFVENPPSRFLDELPSDLLLYTESSPWTGVQADPLRAGMGVPGPQIPRGRAGTSWAGGYDPGPGPLHAGTGGPRRTASARRGPGLLSGGRGAAGNRIAAGSRLGVRPDPGDDFAPGRTVSHPMFGRGTILHKEGSGEALKLTIRFEAGGTKKIIPRHTTLVVHDYGE